MALSRSRSKSKSLSNTHPTRKINTLTLANYNTLNFNKTYSDKKKNRIKGIKKNIYLKNIDGHCKSVKKNFTANKKTTHDRRKLSHTYLANALTNFNANICKIGNLNINLLKKLTLSNTLVPYCCEELKGDKNIDQVNACKLRHHDIEYFKKEYNYNIEISNDDGIVNDKESESITSNNEPVEFLKYLLNNSSESKHRVIISHSNFLTSFTNLLKYLHDNNEQFNSIHQYVNNKKNILQDEYDSLLPDYKQYLNKDNFDDKINYDNLDILHLVINKRQNSGPKIEFISSYRFNENYNFGEEDQYVGPEYKHIFIMRHCIACHNLLDLQPGGKLQKLADLGRFIDSSKYSMCIPQNFEDMISQKENIIKLFRYYGATNLNNLEFGSSVNFRAVLTSYILQLILSNTPYNKDYVNNLMNDNSNTLCTPINIDNIKQIINQYISENTNKFIQFFELVKNKKFINIESDNQEITKTIDSKNIVTRDMIKEINNFISQSKSLLKIDFQSYNPINYTSDVVLNEHFSVTIMGTYSNFLSSIMDIISIYNYLQNPKNKPYYSHYIRVLEENGNKIDADGYNNDLPRLIGEIDKKENKYFTFNNITLKRLSRADLWEIVTKYLPSVEEMYIQDLIKIAELNSNKNINELKSILFKAYIGNERIQGLSINKDDIINKIIGNIKPSSRIRSRTSPSRLPSRILSRIPSRIPSRRPSRIPSPRIPSPRIPSPRIPSRIPSPRRPSPRRPSPRIPSRTPSRTSLRRQSSLRSNNNSSRKSRSLRPKSI